MSKPTDDVPLSEALDKVLGYFAKTVRDADKAKEVVRLDEAKAAIIQLLQSTVEQGRPENKTSDEILTLTASSGKLEEIGYNRGVSDYAENMRRLIGGKDE